ncbi:hypothetical protein [Streptomyces sp. KL116D]|uniref:hypothetical protein n=1 Tax=Streptomyces sp. KL116D TaxID=3045152 RepID=UPI003555F408
MTQQLAAVRPETAQRRITERSRLTGDLGLDSVELAELFERIRGDVRGSGDLGLAGDGDRAEGDTVGSLVRYLALAVPEAAAGGRGAR